MNRQSILTSRTGNYLDFGVDTPRVRYVIGDGVKLLFLPPCAI